MKIGIYSPYLNTLGGGERYMLSIASCLSDKNDVHVFWDNEGIKKEASKRFGLNLDRVQIVPTIFARSTTVFERLYKASKYDLIISLSDGSIPMFLVRKAILHFQQPFIGVGGSSFVTQMKLKNVKEIVCNSLFTKIFIDQEFKTNSTVLYPPVDIEKFNSSVAKKKTILTVGRIHPVKKQGVLIEVFKKAKKRLPAWKFIIAGGLLDQDKQYYESLLKEKDENIAIHANVSFSELRQLYLEASIYWHAAGYAENERTHPEKFEHFGISPVEAMAARTVPLLYNGGGLPEIVIGKEESLLWKTENELIEKTIELVENKQLFESLREWVRIRSQEFNIEKFCQKLQEIIV